MAGENLLELGRSACERWNWLQGYQYLSAADDEAALAPDDLRLLALSAALVGHEDVFIRALDRAHRGYARQGRVDLAARCAFWIGMRFGSMGEGAQASGWFARANRLLERYQGDCVERAYLLLAEVQRSLMAGDLDKAFQTAGEAVRAAERFADDDLHAFALHAQGVARLRQARLAEGLELLDEAMLAVASHELDPIVTGILYCAAISACRGVYARRRVHQWTDSLNAWCERQPDMVPFAGQCLVHRAEIKQLHGAWPEALEEAQRAFERCTRSAEPFAAAAALYTQGELHRVRGEIDDAEAAYHGAARLGRDPQPGLALLRLSQGQTKAALSALRRALDESRDPAHRARILPALVEVELAAGHVEGAQRALGELDDIARGYLESALPTVVDQLRGAVSLAAGDAAGALVALRRAAHGWQALEAPYESARTRELVGRACQELGDREAAGLERDAALEAYRKLGATDDVARLVALTVRADSHGLSPREVVVLRLVAAGGTNRAIAAELGLSERTVERHLSNIFAKLDLSTRSAATAYAYEHGLT